MRKPLFSSPALRDSLIFAACVIGVHLLWKLLLRPVAGSGDAQVLLLSSYNVTPFFDWWCRWQASVSAWLVHLFEPVVRDGCTLYGGSGPLNRITVVWSCTGIKQVLMLLPALLFAHGPWLRKAWYIPAALSACFLFNCLRIALIAGWSFVNFDCFPYLHQGMKYVFYLLLFALWLLWEEKLAYEKPAD